MASFSIPLSGLTADSEALDVISNNLANMNTTAFKDQTASFATLMYQTLGSSGSGDPLQSGMGVQVDTTSTNYSAGSIASTGVEGDEAINGNGFFVVENPTTGQQFLTQAGNFHTDDNGNLVTSNGMQVMGYNSAGTLSPINIPPGQGAPTATTAVSLTANLDATATVGTMVTAPVTITDSLGAQEDATVTFTNTGAGAWSYTVSVPGATGNAAASGNVTFGSNGQLTAPTTNVTGLTFSGAGGAGTNLSDGASPLTFNLDFYNSAGNSVLTGDAATSTTSQVIANGSQSSDFSSFTVASDGTVSVSYANGTTAPVGQLAIAMVTNQQGLDAVGSNDYQTTLASGQVSLGAAGSGGRGVIQDQSLEGSNVDISTEFANLIVAQNAFDANSKSVTTFDTVDQDTLNMMR
jgi:flagellar hook protein FlgE